MAKEGIYHRSRDDRRAGGWHHQPSYFDRASLDDLLGFVDKVRGVPQGHPHIPPRSPQPLCPLFPGAGHVSPTTPSVCCDREESLAEAPFNGQSSEARGLSIGVALAGGLGWRCRSLSRLRQNSSAGLGGRFSCGGLYMHFRAFPSFRKSGNSGN